MAGSRGAGQCQRGDSSRVDLTRVEAIIRKGFHPSIDSYSAFFENDRTHRHRAGRLAAPARLPPHLSGGLATDFCVAWSAEDAVRLGYEVVLIEDACRGIGLPTAAGRTTLDDARARLARLGVRLMRSDDLLT